MERLNLLNHFGWLFLDLLQLCFVFVELRLLRTLEFFPYSAKPEAGQFLSYDFGIFSQNAEISSYL